MIQEEVYIQRPLIDVWDFVVLEFAKVFKCSPSKIEGRSTTTYAKTTSGAERKVIQTIKEVVLHEKIVLITKSDHDYVEMVYLFKDDENGVFLSSYEIGKGQGSFFQKIGYKLMQLPILRNSTKKRLRSRLLTIKGILEGTLEQEL